MHPRLARLLMLLSLSLAGTVAAQAGSPRWQRLEDFLQRSTTGAGYPGAVALVERHGEIVFAGHYGHQDIARSVPMRADSIFRIYSMTKPVVSVAALLLLEEGRLSLDDPLARFEPAFAGLRVQGPAGAAAPARPLTLRHLFTHTSGWSGDDHAHPAAAAALAEAAIGQAPDLAAIAARLATVPLADEPGTHFHYESANTLLLGRVVEVASGQRLADFLQARIFDPLGMADTGFEVPPAQRHRVVDLPTGSPGALVRAATASARTPGVRLDRHDNAAGGLYSTAADYLAFARQLLGRPAPGQPLLLSRKTRQLMMADQLGTAFPAPVEGFSRGEGFGLGGYVVTDVGARGRLGSVGQFGWSGAASTYFTVDPAEDLVAILLMQYVPGNGPRLPSPATPFYNLVYQAIDAPPPGKAGKVARDADQSVFSRR